MLYELRQYTCQPGQRDAVVKCMEEDVIPFQVANGMVILASYVGEDTPDNYVWIRRFKDEEERTALYEKVYQSDHWKNVIGPKIGPLLDRTGMNITRLTPTPKSPLQ